MDEPAAFALFGNPVAQSLSPLMHGAAYASMGLRATYRAFEAKDAAEIVRAMGERDIQGASVTIPFKETVMPLLDEVDADAAAIGAVNTIIRRDGKFMGCNTDGRGLIRDLTNWIAVRGRTFVILGAGGAARAAVWSLIKEGAAPILVNRTEEKARRLADRFGCRWAPEAEIGRLEADALINTTPLGMVPDTGRTPLEKHLLSRFPCVMDMIYNPPRTRLLREAEAAGCAVRSGLGMFIHQGAEQIRLWTGMEPPRERMRQVVMERLEAHGEDQTP
jgi:shikimate dehydrogenase